jgi:hypothetical protein
MDNDEHVLLLTPPVSFKKHRHVPKQMSVEEDVAKLRPELSKFYAVHPHRDHFESAQEVLIAFIGETKRLYRQNDVTVAFRRPKRRGKVRLVEVGPDGDETMIGAGDTEYDALMDAQAKEN